MLPGTAPAMNSTMMESYTSRWLAVMSREQVYTDFAVCIVVRGLLLDLSHKLPCLLTIRCVVFALNRSLAICTVAVEIALTELICVYTPKHDQLVSLLYQILQCPVQCLGSALIWTRCAQVDSGFPASFITVTLNMQCEREHGCLWIFERIEADLRCIALRRHVR